MLLMNTSPFFHSFIVFYSNLFLCLFFVFVFCGVFVVVVVVIFV